MILRGSRFFALPHTFQKRDPKQVITELQDLGASGVNLALNYHASRDFLLRQGPSLAYLDDGFHYYKPDLTKYPAGGIVPSAMDFWPTSELLDAAVHIARNLKFDIGAWAVFLHNSAIGKANLDATVTNALGNHFLSELCPSNFRVQSYVRGLVSDLCTRGIESIAIESLHFHGARHGEHHERFFLEMSKTTEFLFSLCFCASCISAFEAEGGAGIELKTRVINALQPFLTERDPWLGKDLSEDLLKEILGEEISGFLRSREKTVTSLYATVRAIAHKANVKVRYVDQSPLLDPNCQSPLDLSWQLGIDFRQLQKWVDAYEPLIYRAEISHCGDVARHYQESINPPLIPILRPTFPDNLTRDGLQGKVEVLVSMGIKEVDFYLLDTMRPRDLDWIKAALV